MTATPSSCWPQPRRTLATVSSVVRDTQEMADITKVTLTTPRRVDCPVSSAETDGLFCTRRCSNETARVLVAGRSGCKRMVSKGALTKLSSSPHRDFSCPKRRCDRREGVDRGLYG